MKYLDFVDLSYTPAKSDLICDFYVDPVGIPIELAAGGVAAESSIGTWTELTTQKAYVDRLAAKVFSIEGNNIKIAYPVGLFEPGNMPNILSSVAGNVFGLKELAHLRLNSIHFPKSLAKSFPGPKYGISGIRKLFKVKDRPLVGTIIKPKLGLNSKDHASVAYDAWLGGCDVVKDDENLSSQSFNSFKKRLALTLKAKEKAEKKTGEKKAYLVNVTAECNEMLKRAELVERSGGEYVMIDILTAGFSSVQSLREHGLKLAIHAHRAGHAAFTKDPHHGIAMPVIATISRLLGMDQLHVGTAVGKMSESKEEVLANIAALKSGMFGIRPSLPVASGGLYPTLIPRLMEIFGNDVVIQAGGGIHGNPLGTVSGAIAMRQAVDASLEGIPLDEYAKSRRELSAALEKWK